jgi:hypothetical protein
MTSHIVQHQQLDQHEYNFMLDPESTVSVSDEEKIASRMGALDITKNDVTFGSDNDEDRDEEDEDLDIELQERAEETRLRYARLQARGRAAELAYNNRIQREREHTYTDTRERSRSHSKSRSRPSTPMLGALFKRDNFALPITRSRSPPVNSVPEKS